MPLLFAREGDHVVDTLGEVAAPNKIKKVLKEYTPFKRMIYQKRGQKVFLVSEMSESAYRMFFSGLKIRAKRS